MDHQEVVKEDNLNLNNNNYNIYLYNILYKYFKKIEIIIIT